MEKITIKEFPKAKYSKFGEKIRNVIPGPVQCSVGCGGRNCKWENPLKWSGQDQAIRGVFSSWVLADVLAMSRPSTEVIQKYEIIKQFKESNICSIINLQRPGEHASCGPPLHRSSQFTYDPQVFMDNDIFFYNFGWKDYGVMSLSTVLDMVKVVAFAVSEGKVAVHCHAGLGRTGVLIACYLVYTHRMDATLAIHTVRRRRPNSIQTRGQIACIQGFVKFLKPLRIIFPQVAPYGGRLTLLQFLLRQRHLLHGFESRELHHVPKIVYVVCQRLVEIATASQEIGFSDTRTTSMTGPKARRTKKKRSFGRKNTVERMKETLPGAFVNEQLDSKNPVADLLDSQQEMDALLLVHVSPSTNPRENSMSKSTSLPESCVFGCADTDTLSLPAKEQQKTSGLIERCNAPILVAPSKPIFSENSSTENIPGKPPVVLVKQGSRSSCLTRPGDNNVNNNNRMVRTENDTACSKKSLQNKDIDEKDLDNIRLDLPSPTPSVRDPELSPRCRVKSIKVEIDNIDGDEPSNRNWRRSAGRQERVVPTGVPSRGHIGIKAFDEGLNAGDGNVTDEECKALKYDGRNCNPERIGENGNSAETDHKTADAQLFAADELKMDAGDLLAADSLEEITEIKGDGKPFQVASESEKEYAKSSTSKVSWMDTTKGKDEKLLEYCEDVSEQLIFGNAKRALSPRVGNAQETIDSGDLRGLDEKQDESSMDNKKKQTSYHVKITQENEKRPKSAGFSKAAGSNFASAVKKPKVGHLYLSKSLCDLRKLDRLSRDVLATSEDGSTSNRFPSLKKANSGSGEDLRGRTGSASGRRRIKDPITVAMALADTLRDDEQLQDKVHAKQVGLNATEGAWSSLHEESDSHLLSRLMWSWIEQLAEPILGAEDVEALIEGSRLEATERSDSELVERALTDLGKPVSSTLRCVLDCVARLPPLPADLESSIVRRATLAFTQVSYPRENIGSEEQHLVLMKLDQLGSLFRSYFVGKRARNLKKRSFSRGKKDDDATGKVDSEFTGRISSEPA